MKGIRKNVQPKPIRQRNLKGDLDWRKEQARHQASFELSILVSPVMKDCPVMQYPCQQDLAWFRAIRHPVNDQARSYSEESLDIAQFEG